MHLLYALALFNCLQLYKKVLVDITKLNSVYCQGRILYVRDIM